MCETGTIELYFLYIYLRTFYSCFSQSESTQTDLLLSVKRPARRYCDQACLLVSLLVHLFIHPMFVVIPQKLQEEKKQRRLWTQADLASVHHKLN